MMRSSRNLYGNYKAENTVDLKKKISGHTLIPALSFGILLEPADRVGSRKSLLFDPPGTRKTYMTFYKVDDAALTSKWVGDTEK